VHLGVEVPETFPISDRNADARILASALALKQQRKTVVFITKDTNLRVKADALGLSAVDYETTPRNIDEVYRGWRDVAATRETIDRFYKEPALTPEELGTGELYPNEFVRLSSDGGAGGKSVLGRYHAADGKIVVLRDMRSIWGIRPRTWSSASRWTSCWTTRSLSSR
jgi:PhoH-like ATPase